MKIIKIEKLKMTNIRRVWLNSALGIFFILISFLALMVISNYWMRSVEFDFTEEKAYTLSPATDKILARIDAPLNVYFFYSRSKIQNTMMASYGSRISEILRQYERLAKGKIKLQILDPEEFSEAEDSATNFGISPFMLKNGEKAFLGLAVTTEDDRFVTLPVFNMSRERLLEYDISQLIYRSVLKKLPSIGVMSGLPISGTFDQKANVSLPAWQIYKQLRTMYDVHDFSMDTSSIEGVSLLLLIQPTQLSDSAIAAIEQFALKGGKIAAFIDPLTEFSLPTSIDPKFLGLLRHWGVEMIPAKVVADLKLGLFIPYGVSSFVHRGILSPLANNFNPVEVVSGGVQRMNMSSVGILELRDKKDQREKDIYSPILLSSDAATAVSAYRYRDLQTNSKNQLYIPNLEKEKPLILAARVSTSATAAFASTGFFQLANPTVHGSVDMIVVADTNLLLDSFWLKANEQYNKTVLTTISDNANFVFNIIDLLSGGEDMLGIRASERGVLRPFTRVDEIRRIANLKLQDQQNNLQKRLKLTEEKINKLKNNRGKNELSMTMEEQNTLAQFNRQASNIRKQLRWVHLQLNQDIERLGAYLKFFNILFIPILLLIGLLFRWTFVRMFLR